MLARCYWVQIISVAIVEGEECVLLASEISWEVPMSPFNAASYSYPHPHFAGFELGSARSIMQMSRRPMSIAARCMSAMLCCVAEN
jgi:hypothetical protein